jgi:hypothetical protein
VQTMALVVVDLRNDFCAEPAAARYSGTGPLAPAVQEDACRTEHDNPTSKTASA